MVLKSKFAWSVFVLQLFFIALFTVYTKYGKELDASLVNRSEFVNAEGRRTTEDAFYRGHPMFQDINMLVFAGIGFLYAFLRRYGYSGVGMNFLLCAIGLQWGVLTEGFWEMKDGKIELSVTSLIKGEFAAVSGVIALGGIFGKVGLLQMVVFVIIDVFTYTTMNHIRQTYLQVSDAGESIALHMFSAVFGCSTAFVLDKKAKVQGNPNESNSYTSNLFCMLGSLIIWVYWPSFNAALCGDAETQHRCVMNTFFALIGSGVTCYAASSLFHKENKFVMSHIQNGALAGAVAVGSVADLMIQPFGALAIGALTGCLSVAGFKYFTPFLANLKIYDPCGINSLHALPGLFGGCIGVLVTFLANTETYGFSLYKFYPAMAPMTNTTEFSEIQLKVGTFVEPGLGRTLEYQALYQFVYVIVFIVAASLMGMLTGAVLRLKILNPIEDHNMYLDDIMWDLEDVDIKQEKPKYENTINNVSSKTAL